MLPPNFLGEHNNRNTNRQQWLNLKFKSEEVKKKVSYKKLKTLL
jgi:hypothetical protein